MSIEFKIGCDPEFFLLDTQTGKHVSAFGMIPGTKHDPFPVEGGAVQVDGMALEFNIEPVTTLIDWHKNIGRVLKQLRDMVPIRYEFDFSPVAHFGNEYIESQPDEAKALGCDPDFNAWLGGVINPKPDGSLGIRTASGHVHVGWTNDQDVTDPEHIQACMMLTKQLDFYLGVPSLTWDQNSLRRSMYGAPGAFRPKRYGVEYRTLSNAWVNDEDLRAYVFNMTGQGAKKLLEGKRVYENFEDNNKYINFLFDQSNWSDIYETVFGSLKFLKDADYRHIESLINTSAKKGNRAEYDKLVNLYEQGYFRNKLTYEMVSYEDTPYDDYKQGLYYNPNDVYRYAKSEDAPKPEYLTNFEYLKTLKSKPKKTAKIAGNPAGEIMIEVLPGEFIQQPFIPAGQAFKAGIKAGEWKGIANKQVLFPNDPFGLPFANNAKKV